jgi:hypothetical protein
MSKNQYSWADKFPTLTELFFGKDDPATYAPSYLSGKGKKAITKKPIKEVQTKAPKNAKSLENPNGMTDKKPTRGTRKDFGLQKKLKDQLK